MAEDWQQRTRLILNDTVIEKLKSLKVLVVGVGGVGAYAAEMLVRAGLGNITIVDGDTVNVTNLNRQLIALCSTVGKPKTEVLSQRLKDINLDLNIEVIDKFLTVDDIEGLFANTTYDYVVDAIDTVAPKVALISHCLFNKVKIISSMGAGGRIDPSQVQYADLSETYHDGLAKAVRTKLKEQGIRKGLKVVWSPEQPSKSALKLTSDIKNKKSSYGTVSYMPCIFGCYLAAAIINKERKKSS